MTGSCGGLAFGRLGTRRPTTVKPTPVFLPATGDFWQGHPLQRHAFRCPEHIPHKNRTDPIQNPHSREVEGVPKDEPPPHNPHTSGHKQHRFPHPGRVPEEYGLSEDLAEIVANWDSLPDALKAAILAKVREAVRE